VKKGENVSEDIFLRSFRQIFPASKTVLLSYGHVRHSFICQGTSARRQRRDFVGLGVKLPPVIASLTTQGNLVKFRFGYSFISLFVSHVSVLPKDTSTNELAGLSPHYLFWMLTRQARKLWIPTFKVFWS